MRRGFDKWWRLACLILFGGLAGCGLQAEPAHPLADYTVVVANASDPDSVEIARAYQAFRGIPEKNVILLPMSSGLAIDRATFVEELFNPLRSEFMERGLTHGEFLSKTDVHGRREILWLGLSVRYLVLCRGVPLKIKGGDKETDQPIFDAYVMASNGRLSMPGVFMRTNGSVDGELSLLAHDQWPATGVIPNPIANKLPVDEKQRILRVSRLDGPTKADVLNMIDGVREVEAKGLRGRAYFDLRNRPEGDAYRMGDDWIREASNAVIAADFDTTVDNRPGMFTLEDRMDMPAIYVGWYFHKVRGPFLIPGFRFAPGAIAMHLHSTSAGNPRLGEQHWVGPLISRGAAATVGNVYEPYLVATHHFDIILKGMLAGFNFGDSSYAALPFLSWQAAAFGDPLYQPFKVEASAMYEAAMTDFDAELDSAVILREVNRLETAGEKDAAFELLRKSNTKWPSPALAMALAKRQTERGESELARAVILPFSEVQRIEPQAWAVYLEVAAQLIELDHPVAATRIYRELIPDRRLPRDFRKVVLKRALDLDIGPSKDERAVWTEQLDHILEQERLEKEKAEAAKAAHEAAKEAKKKAAAEKEADD
jgi:uncharacterized protein (TIGR03790 family)